MKTSPADLLKLFINKTYPNQKGKRGRKIFERNNVNPVFIDNEKFNPEFTVESENFHYVTYHTAISNWDNPSLQSTCDCPSGIHCKHIAACIFYLIHKGDFVPVVSDNPIEFREYEFLFSEVQGRIINGRMLWSNDHIRFLNSCKEGKFVPNESITFFSRINSPVVFEKLNILEHKSGRHILILPG